MVGTFFIVFFITGGSIRYYITYVQGRQNVIYLGGGLNFK